MNGSEKNMMTYLNSKGQEQLVSLLYNKGLLPEQLQEGGKGWNIMKGIIIGWKACKAQTDENATVADETSSTQKVL